MPVELLLLLQHQHEVVAEAALHHHPVHSTLKSRLTKGEVKGKTKDSKADQIVTGQVDVGGQEDDIFALQRRDGLVHLH